jgi:hypothetical protein
MYKAVLLPQFVPNRQAQREFVRARTHEFGAKQHAERLGMQGAACAIQ